MSHGFQREIKIQGASLRIFKGKKLKDGRNTGHVLIVPDKDWKFPYTKEKSIAVILEQKLRKKVI
jgi:hypothetical protein